MSQDYRRNASAVNFFGSPSRAEPIFVDGESITAFVGPAFRGPVDRAVPVNCVEDFEKHFGMPDFHCRMKFAVRQFFVNGGCKAVVVRVSGTTDRARIHLPGLAGELLLEARNPGPLEFLRASVDYDGIAADDEDSFNIIVQRLRGAESAWIDEQEYYRAVTIDPDSRDFIGKILTQSELVRLATKAPAARPEQTIKALSAKEAGYIVALTEQVGSAAPSDYDLIGSAVPGTGLGALETVRDIAHVCLISGASDAALGPVVMHAADRFCRAHQALLIVDPPGHWQRVEDVLRDQQRSDFTSPNAVTWFPCARVRSVGGESILTSATGAIAAALAEMYRTRNVERLHADAFTMLRGNLRLDTRIDAEDAQRLCRVGVNILSQRSALHLQLCGRVTQARHTNVVSGSELLDVRSEALFILRRLREGTRWTASRASGPHVWRELYEQIEAFMEGLDKRALFVPSGNQPGWIARADAETNSGLVLNGSSTSFIVAFALRESGKFLRFRFVQSPEGCRITELGRRSGLALAV